jgi:serine/threonine protein kinase
MAANFKPRLMGVGASALVFSLNDDAVLKVPRAEKDAIEAQAREQRIFEILEHERSPYLIACIYRVSGATFMPRMSSNFKDIIKAGGYAQEDIYRWMGQLCGGAVFLERHGLGHCDLRPDNLLIGKDGNLRITDLGETLAVNSRLPTGTEPFARIRSKEDGEGSGSYGRVGAYTECFAIGSIFYSFIRGHYPYEHEGFAAWDLIKKFQRKEFPLLTNSDNDVIISNCWYGAYQSVAELEQVFRDMVDGMEWYMFEAETDAWIMERKNECAAWVNNRGLESTRLSDAYIRG